jgi:hypothetical protein
VAALLPFELFGAIVDAFLSGARVILIIISFTFSVAIFFLEAAAALSPCRCIRESWHSAQPALPQEPPSAALHLKRFANDGKPTRRLE